MRWTGKRHPYSSDYKIGLAEDGRILAYEVTFYQNAGASADLSPAVLERTLFHTTNSYFIPHVRATAVSCRTHLPPNTAFRGFGGPQAMFVLEAAITQAAAALGVPAVEIQRKNLLRRGDEFPYGMRLQIRQPGPLLGRARQAPRPGGLPRPRGGVQPRPRAGQKRPGRDAGLLRHFVHHHVCSTRRPAWCTSTPTAASASRPRRWRWGRASIARSAGSRPARWASISTGSGWRAPTRRAWRTPLPPRPAAAPTSTATRRAWPASRSSSA